MIIVCQNCGKEIKAESTFCTYCGVRKDLQAAAVLPASSSPQRKNKKSLKLLCALGTIGLLVVLVVMLNANMLLPWQLGARRNKQVILNYAAEHYPNAQFVEGHYNSAKFFVWNNFGDAGVFNLDGIEFKITAEGGKILIDGYPKARACAQFDKIIQDNFLEPRGISAKTDYIFVDNYNEIYPYTGSLGVKVKSIDQGTTPQEIGWLYDFYSYWKKEGDFLTSYSVHLSIIKDGRMMYHLDYNDDSEFPNEAAFYAAFKVG